MKYKRKTKQNRKNYGVYFHAEKNGMCTGKKKYEKVTIHKKCTELQNTRTHRILLWISEMLLKFIIVCLFHVGGVREDMMKVPAQKGSGYRSAGDDMVRLTR